MKKNIMPWQLVLILLIGCTLLTFRVGARFYDVREATHVWIPASVRAFDVYGTDTVGVMMTRNTAPIPNPDDPDTIRFYSHHPAMMVWVPAISTQIMGFHEVGVRFPFIAITILTICVFYVFVRRLFNQQVALWAAFFYMIAPFTLFYGRVAAPDVIGFLWVMLYATIIIRWLRQPTRARLLALCVLVWLAVWTAWTAIFFIASFGIAAMILGQRQHRIAVIGLGILSIIALVALVGFYQLQWDGSIDSMLKAYDWRSSTATSRPDAEVVEAFTVFDWMGRMALDITVFATVGVVTLALIGLAPVLRRKPKLPYTSLVMIGALFVGSLSYQLTFMSASYIHDVDKASFALILAVLAALGYQYLHEPKRARVGRPLTHALVTVAIIQGIAWTLVMHSSGRQPLLDDAIAIAQNAPAEAQIAANLPGVRDDMINVYTMVVQFYTFREVLWNATPEEALAAAEGRPVYYINCPEEPADEAPRCESELLEP